jgi:predicted Zn finger-like uncharacterized protein
MPFPSVCPGCRTVYQIGEQHAGRTVRCKKCQQIFTVARPAAAIPVPPPRPESGSSSAAYSARRAPRAQAPPPLREQTRPVSNGRNGLTVALIVGSAVAVLLVVSVAFAGLWLMLRSNNDRESPRNQAGVVNRSGTTVGRTPKRQTGEAAFGPASGSETRPRTVGNPLAEAPNSDTGESYGPRLPRGQLSARALKDLKGATVFIKVEAGKALSCSGSGFLIKVEGNTGYIITNHHVVNPEAELLQPVRSRNGTKSVRTVKYKPKNAAVTAVFHSGTKAERPLAAEIIATDDSRDLAVLRVTGLGDWPRPITLEQKAALVETMPVYILGFPFGEALSFKQGNPAITINKGSVSSLRENEFGQMKAVQIDGAINPGNSGGPVVDEDGRLVGISVATMRGTGIGLAIAPEELTHLFEGRVAAVGLHERKFDDSGVEFYVELQFIDPQKQIRSAALLYLVGTSPQLSTKREADGAFYPLPGAERLDLQIDGQKASGLLDLAFIASNQRYLIYQTTYVNGSGNAVYTQVISRPLRPEPKTKAPRGTPKTADPGP